MSLRDFDRVPQDPHPPVVVTSKTRPVHPTCREETVMMWKRFTFFKLYKSIPDGRSRKVRTGFGRAVLLAHSARAEFPSLVASHDSTGDGRG